MLSVVINFNENQSAKTLGLIWCPSSDNLMYSINPNSREQIITKRMMLSDIAHLFDPLGLLSPCLIIAKVMLQRLWLEKLSWDDPLPSSLQSAWSEFRSQLSALNSIRIHRKVLCCHPKIVELHGFSDASEETYYGGCLYVRSTDPEGEIFVHLLCSKTKVAPLKTITLPRLELSGALILSRLARVATSALSNVNFSRIVLWSDSTIVLGWIKKAPKTLKPFVSNRVAEIQTLTLTAEWRHVTSADNPADLLSRGVKPKNIRDTKLWWYGPNWLSKPRKC